MKDRQFEFIGKAMYLALQEGWDYEEVMSYVVKTLQHDELPTDITQIRSQILEYDDQKKEVTVVECIHCGGKISWTPIFKRKMYEYYQHLSPILIDSNNNRFAFGYCSTCVSAFIEKWNESKHAYCVECERFHRDGSDLFQRHKFFLIRDR